MLRKMGRSVFVKFFLPVCTSFLIFAAIIFGYLIPFFETEILEQKKDQCRAGAQIVHSVIQEVHGKYQRGELSLEEAKQKAFGYVKSMRYGPNGNGYFWINDQDTGRILMHPYIDLADPRHTRLLRDVAAIFVQESKNQDEAFVHYDWYEMADTSKLLAKISFLKRFQPWRWQIGTGFYIEKEKQTLARLLNGQIIICLVALAGLMLVSYVIVSQARKSEARLLAATQAIGINEKKYRELFEKSSDAILVLGEGLQYIDCNEAAVRLLGYGSKEELFTTDPKERHPEFQPDGSRSLPLVRHYLARTRDEGSLVLEWYFKRKDGSLLPVNLKLTALEHDDGRVFFHVIARDISVMKQNEKRLQEYQEHLAELVKQRTNELQTAYSSLSQELEMHKKLQSDIRQILDSVSDAMRVIDLKHNVLYTNQRFSELTGIPKEKITGTKCTEHFRDEHCGTALCEINLVLRGRKAFERETTRKMPDGRRTLTFLQTCAPYLSPEGEIIGVVENFKDITERKKADEFERQTAIQKGRIDMANNILHDIGNAIISIGTSSVKLCTEREWEELQSLKQFSAFFASRQEELAGAIGPEKTAYLLHYVGVLIENLDGRSKRYRELFGRITKSASHISSILDLQRTYAKGNIVSDGKLEIIKLVGDALFMLSSSFEKRDIAVRKEYEIESAYVSGDHTRIMQVFINILRNACEAFDESDKGEEAEKFLKIHIYRKEDRVFLEFEDNATGFDPAMAEKFFSKGFTTKTRDSGLGLHECRSILESHNGAIWMHSEGKGTCSRVTVEMDIEGTESGKQT